MDSFFAPPTEKVETEIIGDDVIQKYKQLQYTTRPNELPKKEVEKNDPKRKDTFQSQDKDESDKIFKEFKGINKEDIDHIVKILKNQDSYNNKNVQNFKNKNKEGPHRQ